MKKKYLILPFILSLFSLISVGAQDTVPPVINLVGPNPMHIYVGTSYFEPGITAWDDIDGDITDKIVIKSNNVDTSTPGTYGVHYSVSDNAGNTTDTIRVVKVTHADDTIPPIITLLGDNPMSLDIGDPYNEPGATAWDNKDGDITDSIEINSDSVNTSSTGSYRVHYTLYDAANNSAHEIRIVNVGSTGIKDDNPFNFLKPNNFIASYNNGNISIRYTLPYFTTVRLEAYGIKGKLVKVIADKFMQKGSYSVNWDSKRYGSGVYYIKLSTGNNSLIRKTIIIK